MILDMKSIGLTRKALKEIADFVEANPAQTFTYGKDESVRIILDANGDTIFVILPGDKMKRVTRFL